MNLNFHALDHQMQCLYEYEARGGICVYFCAGIFLSQSSIRSSHAYSPSLRTALCGCVRLDMLYRFYFLLISYVHTPLSVFILSLNRFRIEWVNFSSAWMNLKKHKHTMSSFRMEWVVCMQNERRDRNKISTLNDTYVYGRRGCRTLPKIRFTCKSIEV